MTFLLSLIERLDTGNPRLYTTDMNDVSEEVTEETLVETTVETSAATQTDWHRLLALVQEAALVPLAIEVLTELLADLKPIKIDLVLLRRKSARWTAAQVARLPDGIRQSIANHILCEFKYTQSVNYAALVQALMYDFLYRSSRKLARQKVATFVISARTPRPAVLQEFGYVATDRSGVYRSMQTLLAPITLLVLNQLSKEPYNALFKVFASQRTEREASFALLEQIGAKQWSPGLGEVLTGLQTLLQQQEGGKMKGIVIDPEYVKRLGREMEKTVLANLTTEKLLANVSPEQILAMKMSPLIAKASPKHGPTPKCWKSSTAAISNWSVTAMLSEGWLGR